LERKKVLWDWIGFDQTAKIAKKGGHYHTQIRYYALVIPLLLPAGAGQKSSGRSE
jgi:hypothetical protein